jgi:nucleotide-binding universal stress UspA family protein
MPEAERRADALLRRSSEIADRFNVPAETALLRGREVGACLVEEAHRTHADAVFVRFRSRPAPLGHYLVSSTVSALLSASPCPVITFHLPHH